MREIVIDPGKAPQIVWMPDDGQALERWLGGDALLRVHPAKPAALLYAMRKSNLFRALADVLYSRDPDADKVCAARGLLESAYAGAAERRRSFDVEVE